MKKLKNEENNKGLAPLVLIILLALAGGLVYGGAKIIKKPALLLKVQMPEESSGETTEDYGRGLEDQGLLEGNVGQVEKSPSLTENFDKRGNLTDWDSKLEKETGSWILLYDEPGRLAIAANLVFDNSSKCDLGNGEEICDKSKFELGTTARVQGVEEGGKVKVTKLTKVFGL